jgi:hypothetical protein
MLSVGERLHGPNFSDAKSDTLSRLRSLTLYLGFTLSAPRGEVAADSQQWRSPFRHDPERRQSPRCSEITATRAVPPAFHSFTYDLDVGKPARGDGRLQKRHLASTALDQDHASARQRGRQGKPRQPRSGADVSHRFRTAYLIEFERDQRIAEMDLHNRSWLANGGRCPWIVAQHLRVLDELVRGLIGQAVPGGKPRHAPHDLIGHGL